MASRVGHPVPAEWDLPLGMYSSFSIVEPPLLLLPLRPSARLSPECGSSQGWTPFHLRASSASRGGTEGEGRLCGCFNIVYVGSRKSNMLLPCSIGSHSPSSDPSSPGMQCHYYVYAGACSHSFRSSEIRIGTVCQTRWYPYHHSASGSADRMRTF